MHTQTPHAVAAVALAVVIGVSLIAGLGVSAKKVGSAAYQCRGGGDPYDLTFFVVGLRRRCQCWGGLGAVSDKVLLDCTVTERDTERAVASLSPSFTNLTHTHIHTLDPKPNTLQPPDRRLGQAGQRRPAHDRQDDGGRGGLHGARVHHLNRRQLLRS